LELLNLTTNFIYFVAIVNIRG